MRNKSVYNAVQMSAQNNFKSMNNLLQLQENHVEEFFEYHGKAFLESLEKLMEDVMERTISQMLAKLEFVTDSTGKLSMHPDAMREYEKITQENINLDLEAIRNSALNTEVINQRRLAKQQYLESQGFSTGVAGGQPGMNGMNGMNGMGPGMAGAGMAGAGMAGAGGMYAGAGMAMNNGSGYPVPPSGQDGYGRPYWIDPQTGNMSYEPPSAGLHLAEKAQKLAAWGKWLM